MVWQEELWLQPYIITYERALSRRVRWYPMIVLTWRKVQVECGFYLPDSNND